MTDTTAPDAPLPPALSSSSSAPTPNAPTLSSSAPPAQPSPAAMTGGVDLNALADLILTKMSRSSPQAADEQPQKLVRLEPSKNLGRPLYVWLDGQREPTIAVCTREQLDDAHPGMIDCTAFPSGQAPMPLQCVSQDRYAWR